MTDRQQVRRRLVFVAVLACTLPSPAASQDVPEGFAPFRLFNECKPMGLLVVPLPPDAAAINLTQERIRTLAESRLRAARLCSDDLAPFLEVHVRVFGLAFAVDINFYKILYDPISNESGLGATWRLGTVGTHGRDGDYIVQTLSEWMDHFLVEYLRVNEDACR